MKWTIKSRESKEAKLSKWHLKFLLLPRRISYNDSGENTWVWLEQVGCKYKFEDGYEGKRSATASFCSKEEALLRTIEE